MSYRVAVAWFLAVVNFIHTSYSEHSSVWNIRASLSQPVYERSYHGSESSPTNNFCCDLHLTLDGEELYGCKSGRIHHTLVTTHVLKRKCRTNSVKKWVIAKSGLVANDLMALDLGDYENVMEWYSCCALMSLLHRCQLELSADQYSLIQQSLAFMIKYSNRAFKS